MATESNALVTRLGPLLNQMTSRYGWQRAEWLRMLDLLWLRVVGQTIYQHTRILTLTTDGILVIGVSSSVWAQELNYYKLRILEAIHDELPAMTVKDVRTRVKADVVETMPGVEPYRPSPYAATIPVLADTDDLHVLLARVQEKYQQATQEWLQQGFQACEACHAPTLSGYALCVMCELDQKNYR